MQRNALLRGRKDSGQLAVWTGRLTEIGARLIARRREELVPLGQHAAHFYQELGGRDEPLALKYRSAVEGEGPSEIAASLAARLAAAESAEWLKKRSLEGPHRDDIGIDISGRDARKFASQGQKRSAAVALKLAQAEYLAQTRRDRPIVFLDDVFSELDRIRREGLCQLVGRKYQTFLASPHVEDLRRDLFADIQLMRIENGSIRLEQGS
jgi:DNA replication and repair protein RecF